MLPTRMFCSFAFALHAMDQNKTTSAIVEPYLFNINFRSPSDLRHQLNVAFATLNAVLTHRQRDDRVETTTLSGPTAFARRNEFVAFEQNGIDPILAAIERRNRHVNMLRLR